MTNSELKAKLIKDIAGRIQWRLGLAETYAQAKAYVSERSCAGSAVWAEVDKMFNGSEAAA